MLPSRLRAVQCVILVAFIVGCLLSPRLWISKDRIFPLLSPFDFMPGLAYPFDLILLLVFVMLLALWIWSKRLMIGLMALVVFALIFLQDQMRWQPWVYIYGLMLLPFLFQNDKKDNSEFIMLCLQCIIAGVYFWSGIHKFSPSFIDGVYVKILKVSGIQQSSVLLENLGYTIPCFEMLLGLVLMTAKWRNIGVAAAILMHTVILIYLGPLALNDNVIVYPWNVAMIFFVVLAFWETSEHTIGVLFRTVRFRPFAVFLIMVVWVMPIFNFVGYWDHYLSFSLYSNKHSYYYIAIEQRELKKINPKLYAHFVPLKKMQGGELIDTHKWSMTELGVPFYPETRCFKKLTKSFCALHIEDDRLLFLEKIKTRGKTQMITFSCARPFIR